VNRRRLAAGTLVMVSLVALCAGLGALYVDLFVGFEAEPMAPLPADADVSSILSAYTHVQSFVDQWKPGLQLTAVHARYRVDSRGQLVPIGEITYNFAGSREDWLAPIARRAGVHILGATVVLDVDRRMITSFRPSQSDRALFGQMHAEDWGTSDRELLRVAEDNGGKEFREMHADADVDVEVSGHYAGDEWLQTYRSQGGTLWIVIELHSGVVARAEGDACDLFPSSWRTVGHISS
jgi:hypothetical protein